MQITIYRYNDINLKYEFKEICLQYESVELVRSNKYDGKATITIVNEYEAEKFMLEDLLLFANDPSEEASRDHYIVVDITKNKEVETHAIKTTITAIPLINYVLANRINPINSVVPTICYDWYIPFQVCLNILGSLNPYLDSRIKYNNDYKGDKEKYQARLSEEVLITKGKTGLELFNDLTLNYLYYCVFRDWCISREEAETAILLMVCYPTDRSESVIFSESLGNCVLTDYTLNNESEKNVCYTILEDGTITVRGSGKGIRRKEMVSNSLSYEGELETAVAITNAKITIINNGMYEYLKDYDLNDFVTFIDNNLGIKVTKRIESITEYYGTDKNEIEISIGEFVPNVFDKLKGVKK